MKKISLAVLLLTCVITTAWPQEHPPQLLIRAAHCLAVKEELPRSKARTLKEIEKQPRFALSVKDLSAADASVVCEAYTDPQPKKGEK